MTPEPERGRQKDADPFNHPAMKGLMRAQSAPRTLYDPSTLGMNATSNDVSAGQTYTVATAPSNAVSYSGANLAALTTTGRRNG